MTREVACSSSTLAGGLLPKTSQARATAASVTSAHGVHGASAPSVPSVPSVPFVPASPCLPCGPWSPAAPSLPAAPSAPAAPASPCLPCGPCAPSAPSAPAAPPPEGGGSPKSGCAPPSTVAYGVPVPLSSTCHRLDWPVQPLPLGSPPWSLFQIPSAGVTFPSPSTAKWYLRNAQTGASKVPQVLRLLSMKKWPSVKKVPAGCAWKCVSSCSPMVRFCMAEPPGDPGLVG